MNGHINLRDCVGKNAKLFYSKNPENYVVITAIPKGTSRQEITRLKSHGLLSRNGAAIKNSKPERGTIFIEKINKVTPQIKARQQIRQSILRSSVNSQHCICLNEISKRIPDPVLDSLDENMHILPNSQTDVTALQHPHNNNLCEICNLNENCFQTPSLSLSSNECVCPVQSKSKEFFFGNIDKWSMRSFPSSRGYEMKYPLHCNGDAKPRGVNKLCDHFNHKASEEYSTYSLEGIPNSFGRISPQIKPNYFIDQVPLENRTTKHYAESRMSLAKLKNDASYSQQIDQSVLPKSSSTKSDIKSSTFNDFNDIKMFACTSNCLFGQQQNVNSRDLPKNSERSQGTPIKLFYRSSNNEDITQLTPMPTNVRLWNTVNSFGEGSHESVNVNLLLPTCKENNVKENVCALFATGPGSNSNLTGQVKNNLDENPISVMSIKTGRDRKRKSIVTSQVRGSKNVLKGNKTQSASDIVHEGQQDMESHSEICNANSTSVGIESASTLDLQSLMSLPTNNGIERVFPCEKSGKLFSKISDGMRPIPEDGKHNKSYQQTHNNILDSDNSQNRKMVLSGATAEKQELSTLFEQNSGESVMSNDKGIISSNFEQTRVESTLTASCEQNLPTALVASDTVLFDSNSCVPIKPNIKPEPKKSTKGRKRKKLTVKSNICTRNAKKRKGNEMQSIELNKSESSNHTSSRRNVSGHRSPHTELLNEDSSTGPLYKHFSLSSNPNKPSERENDTKITSDLPMVTEDNEVHPMKSDLSVRGNAILKPKCRPQKSVIPSYNCTNKHKLEVKSKIDSSVKSLENMVNDENGSFHLITAEGNEEDSINSHVTMKDNAKLKHGSEKRKYTIASSICTGAIQLEINKKEIPSSDVPFTQVNNNDSMKSHSSMIFQQSSSHIQQFNKSSPMATKIKTSSSKNRKLEMKEYVPCIEENVIPTKSETTNEAVGKTKPVTESQKVPGEFHSINKNFNEKQRLAAADSSRCADLNSHNESSESSVLVCSKTASEVFPTSDIITNPAVKLPHAAKQETLSADNLTPMDQIGEKKNANDIVYREPLSNLSCGRDATTEMDVNFNSLNITKFGQLGKEPVYNRMISTKSLVEEPFCSTGENVKLSMSNQLPVCSKNILGQDFPSLDSISLETLSKTAEVLKSPILSQSMVEEAISNHNTASFNETVTMVEVSSYEGTRSKICNGIPSFWTPSTEKDNKGLIRVDTKDLTVPSENVDGLEMKPHLNSVRPLPIDTARKAILSTKSSRIGELLVNNSKKCPPIALGALTKIKQRSKFCLSASKRKK